MDKSWVKLYRRLRHHEIMRDQNALQVFIWILLSVNPSTGKFITGRFSGSSELGMNPNTFKDVIKRLKTKYKIVTTKPTNRDTEISLVRWANYQAATLSDTNNPPSGHHLDTTTKDIRLENKNKTVVQDEAFKTKCPITTNAPLKEKYPKGHAECVEFIEGLANDRGKKFISPSKQYARLHQILEAGYDDRDMTKVADALDGKYGIGAWDMDNVANWLEKGGVSTAKR